jgi:hypothetical protein
MVVKIYDSYLFFTILVGFFEREQHVFFDDGR